MLTTIIIRRVTEPAMKNHKFVEAENTDTTWYNSGQWESGDSTVRFTCNTDNSRTRLGMEPVSTAVILCALVGACRRLGYSALGSRDGLGDAIELVLTTRDMIFLLLTILGGEEDEPRRAYTWRFLHTHNESMRGGGTVIA